MSLLRIVLLLAYVALLSAGEDVRRPPRRALDRRSDEDIE